VLVKCCPGSTHLENAMHPVYELPELRSTEQVDAEYQLAFEFADFTSDRLAECPPSPRRRAPALPQRFLLQLPYFEGLCLEVTRDPVSRAILSYRLLNSAA
jgi:hypothetical protein